MPLRIKYYKDRIKQLKAELEKVKSRFYIFQELTKAMRTSLRLDEVSYIILTGLTANQGLGFNRAIIFIVDEINGSIKGLMGLGPKNAEEAGRIWQTIEKQKMNLSSLIANYHRIKSGKIAKPSFMQLAQTIEFPLGKKGSILHAALKKKTPLHLRKQKMDNYRNDPLVKKLKIKEAVVTSLWSKNNPFGIIVVDNHITKKTITREDIKMLKIFLNQATGALENSKIYENTLLRSHTDSLTSLWNHGYFQYKLDEIITRARGKKDKVSLLMADIDNFKQFNDTQGHQRGDQALKKVATIIKKFSRKIDIACRYGGEEFAVILPGSSLKEAKMIGNRIRQAVAQKKLFNTSFTISIGVSSFPDNANSKNKLISRADQALYRAKQNGKNQVVD
jgi:diguanylate cyclase (GGDEF)-like protein